MVVEYEKASIVVPTGTMANRLGTAIAAVLIGTNSFCQSKTKSKKRNSPKFLAAPR
jgi:hypothetical protein